MVTETAQEERLKKYDINIKTKYKVNDNVLERNTDNSKNDNIINGIRLEKAYYCHGQLLKKENIFDSRILYTYESTNDEFICKNCGNKGTLEEFDAGCPYCHSNYNIDFVNKELGNKHYYDLIMSDKSYLKKTFIITLIFSFIITIFYVLPNSRTFYFFDILKILGGTVVISLILFLIFYYLDAVILLPSIKNKKEIQNNKQKEFWNQMENEGIEKNKFYNNFNYNLRKYYYSSKNPNIIDYDIIDYNDFKSSYENNNLYVTVNVDVRIVRFDNNKIISKIENKSYYLKKNDITKELKGEINYIKCPSCGASVDATKTKCSYCGTEYNYLQEWYLEREI